MKEFGIEVSGGDPGDVGLLLPKRVFSTRKFVDVFFKIGFKSGRGMRGILFLEGGKSLVQILDLSLNVAESGVVPSAQGFLCGLEFLGKNEGWCSRN